MRDDEHRLQTACVRWWRLQYGGPHGEAARAALYAAAERAGYRYVVVRSVEDFKREVDEYLKHQIIPWQE